MATHYKSNEEEHIQISFINWLREYYPQVIVMHIPNGGKRSAFVGMRLKQMGTHKGASDLFFPALKLWIELKANKDKRVTPEQADFLQKRSEEGYIVHVAYGLADIKEKFKAVYDEQHQ